MTAYGQAVNSVQIFVALTDTGDEHGSIQQDESGDLVRLKRQAVCCMSGAPVVLRRTGRINKMRSYLRFNKRRTPLRNRAALASGGRC